MLSIVLCQYLPRNYLKKSYAQMVNIILENSFCMGWARYDQQLPLLFKEMKWHVISEDVKEHSNSVFQPLCVINGLTLAWIKIGRWANAICEDPQTSSKAFCHQPLEGECYWSLYLQGSEFHLLFHLCSGNTESIWYQHVLRIKERTYTLVKYVVVCSTCDCMGFPCLYYQNKFHCCAVS